MLFNTALCFQAMGLCLSEHWIIEMFLYVGRCPQSFWFLETSTHLSRVVQPDVLEGPEVLRAGAQPGPLALADAVPKTFSFAHARWACCLLALGVGCWARGHGFSPSWRVCSSSAIRTWTS